MQNFAGNRFFASDLVSSHSISPFVEIENLKVNCSSMDFDSMESDVNIAWRNSEMDPWMWGSLTHSYISKICVSFRPNLLLWSCRTSVLFRERARNLDRERHSKHFFEKLNVLKYISFGCEVILLLCNMISVSFCLINSFLALFWSLLCREVGIQPR